MTEASKILSLEPHGADAFVGESPLYEWGRIYGGLVIAQSVCAAMKTVDTEGHSIHCLLYTSPSPRDYAASRMPSSA